MTRRLEWLTLRSSTLLSSLLTALAMFTWSPFECRADNLYGLTYNGYLVQINTSTAAPTSVRGRLSTAIQPFHSLVYHDGYFIATAGPDLPGGGCWVYAFGVTTGDEQYLGNVAGFCPKALTVDANNDLYTAGTTSCSGGTCFQLRKLNSVTLATTNVPNPIPFVANDSGPVDGLAFLSSTQAAMTTLFTTNPGMDYRLLGLSGGVWSSTYQSAGYLPSGTHGLAYNSADTLIYSTTGYDEANGSTSASVLRSVASPYSGSTKTNIGTVTGYPGIVGLTMAPAVGSISSPPVPAGVKQWEPVRESIFN